MSRKDTIIIAVLINAGLLIVLFASALKSSTPEIVATPKQNVIPESHFKPEPIAISGGDEVDQALQKMAATPPAAYTPPASSFAEDLKPFTPVIESAAPPAIAAAPEQKEYSEVKVKKGDVLEKIARQHHTSVDAIIAFNQLGSTNLRIGQVLKIPSKKGIQVQAPTLTTAQPKADGHKYYTVKTGDNPWTIAVKNHMKVEELLRINQLDQEKARKLKPGDKLLIQ